MTAYFKRCDGEPQRSDSDLVESITEVSIISTEQPGDSSAMSVPESIVEGQGEYDLNLFDDQNNEVNVQQLTSDSNVALKCFWFWAYVKP